MDVTSHLKYLYNRFQPHCCNETWKCWRCSSKLWWQEQGATHRHQLQVATIVDDAEQLFLPRPILCVKFIVPMWGVVVFAIANRAVYGREGLSLGKKSWVWERRVKAEERMRGFLYLWAWPHMAQFLSLPPTPRALSKRPQWPFAHQKLPIEKNNAPDDVN